MSIRPGDEEYTQASGTRRNVLAPAVLVTCDENYSGGNQNTLKTQFNRWTLTGGGSVSTLENNSTVYTYGEADGILTASYNAVNLPTPTRDGYTFEGWYKDSGCTEANKINGTTITPTDNTTLYAKWSQVQVPEPEPEPEPEPDPNPIQELYLTTTKIYKIAEDDEEKLFLYRINPNISVGSLKSELDTNGLVSVYKKVDDTEVLVSNNENIGTGMIVRIKRNNETLEFEVSIKGDVDGNGEITATDLAVMNQQILGEIDLSTAQYMALDISNDKDITATDLATMIQAKIGELDLSKVE